MEHRHPLLAGAITGAAEISITYPLQYLKTMSQITVSPSGASSPPRLARIIADTLRVAGIAGFYRGLAPNLAFALPRTGIRFWTYELCANAFRDARVTADSPRRRQLESSEVFVAGLIAGAVEAALCVVPMTTIEVKMVDDLMRPKPQFRGLVHAVTSIARAEGVSGLYRGFTPTMLKLASNQAMRFLLYERLYESLLAHPSLSPHCGGVCASLLSGGVAGAITVFINHPVDVAKSCMQSLHGGAHPSMAAWLGHIARTEGLRGLYRGALIRSLRVCGETALTFTLYAHVSRALNLTIDGRE